VSQIVENTLPEDYVAARETAAFFLVPNPGYLVFRGETRQEYLQRQTTNDLSLLSPTRALPNFLTSASGRILEFFTLLQDSESISMLTQPGHGPGLAEYFKKRIFFNDKVTVEDKSAKWLLIELYGPAAESNLYKLGFDHLPESDGVLRLGDLLAIGATRPAAVRILFAETELNQILAKLQARELNPETREILRVEAVQPGDPEFNGEYTPFELGLERYVSTEKGCYTGQEVLARQVTYDKVVRKLVGLQSDQPILPGENVLADGKNIGVVTSSAASPAMGNIALSVVRKPFDVAGLRVDLAGEKTQSSAVVLLP
jgi:folate-binding protein YgfZ